MVASVVVSTETQTLLSEREVVSVVASETPATTILTSAVQGPPGPASGDQGTFISDPVAYYILSKS